MKRLAALRQYPGAGTAALVGRGDREWQGRAAVLAYFGPKRKRAGERDEAFAREGIPPGRPLDLVGGELLRSLGGWSQVLALRRKGLTVAADARILGSEAFTEHLLAEAARQEKETLRWSRRVVASATLAPGVIARAGIPEKELRAGSRRPGVVRAPRLFCQLAVQGLGYSGARVARFLGVTTSSVNRLAASAQLPEIKRYLKAL